MVAAGHAEPGQQPEPARAAEHRVRDRVGLLGGRRERARPAPMAGLGAVTTSRQAAGRPGTPPRDLVRAETVQRLERAMGALGTAAMASMEQRLAWFRALSAEDRSWIGLVAQAGIAAFVDWVKHPQRRPAVAGEVFGTAP